MGDAADMDEDFQWEKVAGENLRRLDAQVGKKMDYDKVANELAKNLEPKHVQPAKTYGPKGDYIEGWHAIAEANRIFGFNGWSYKIISLDQVNLDLAKDRNGNDQWQAGYTCMVTVEALGQTREDVGFGSGFDKQKGSAVEGATKEAVTDALKRALRTFGNPFGLALYDKSRANVGPNEPPTNWEAVRDRIKGEIERSMVVDHLKDVWRSNWDDVRPESAMPEPMKLELTNAKDIRRKELESGK